jgi:hypothetical protein
MIVLFPTEVCRRFLMEKNEKGESTAVARTTGDM